MSNHRLLWVLVVCWMVLYAWSWWALFGAPVSGDGFTRGLNRVMSFLGWQIVAGFFGIGIWYVARSGQTGMVTRWLCRVPALCTIGLLVFIVGSIVVTRISKPSPAPAPAMPTTLPVKPDQ